MNDSPLSGKVICITRSLEQATKSAELVKKRGAIPFIFPVIKQVATELDETSKKILKNLNSYDYIIFTSANAVRFFSEALTREGIELNDLQTRIACVGPQTAAQAEILGLTVSIVPDEFLGASLEELLIKTLKPGSSILYPRPKKVSRDLKKGLEDSGYRVDELIIYETVADETFADEAASAFAEGTIDAVTFASGSAVKNFVYLLSSRLDLKSCLENVFVAVIGPSTEKAAAKYGIKVDVVPDEFTFSGMLDALEKAFSAIE